MKGYFDYASTTPTDQRVVDAMMPFFTEKFANTSSVYNLGLESKKALEKSRITIAEKLGALPEEIVFTSSATESNNLAIKGAVWANQDKGKHIIVSTIEHDCVLVTANWLSQNGFDVSFVNPEKNGVIDPEKIKKEIREDTILISLIMVNNEIGTIQPLEEVGKICAEKNILFHTDAVQAFGKILINVRQSDLHMLTLSSHKIYGPKGVGCLYVKKGVKLQPILHGGGHEFRLRSGTVNHPGVVGFAKAVEIIADEMAEEQKRVAGLAKKMIDGVKARIKDVELNGNTDQRVPNIVNLRFARCEGESLQMSLDMQGFQAATGSACGSAKLKPSHVLMAMGLKPEQAHGSVRFSFGRWTKEEDVDRLLEVLPGVVEKLRKMSPIK